MKFELFMSWTQVIQPRTAVHFILFHQIRSFWFALRQIVDSRRRVRKGPSPFFKGIRIAPREPAHNPVVSLFAVLGVDEVARHKSSQVLLGGIANPVAEMGVALGLTLRHVDPARLLVHEEHDAMEGEQLQGEEGREVRGASENLAEMISWTPGRPGS